VFAFALSTQQIKFYCNDNKNNVNDNRCNRNRNYCFGLKLEAEQLHGFTMSYKSVYMLIDQCPINVSSATRNVLCFVNKPCIVLRRRHCKLEVCRNSIFIPISSHSHDFFSFSSNPIPIIRLSSRSQFSRQLHFPFPFPRTTQTVCSANVYVCSPGKSEYELTSHASVKCSWKGTKVRLHDRHEKFTDNFFHSSMFVFDMFVSRA